MIVLWDPWVKDRGLGSSGVFLRGGVSFREPPVGLFPKEKSMVDPCKTLECMIVLKKYVG